MAVGFGCGPQSLRSLPSFSLDGGWDHCLPTRFALPADRGLSPHLAFACRGAGCSFPESLKVYFSRGRPFPRCGRGCYRRRGRSPFSRLLMRQSAPEATVVCLGCGPQPQGPRLSASGAAIALGAVGEAAEVGDCLGSSFLKLISRARSFSILALTLSVTFPNATSRWATFL